MARTRRSPSLLSQNHKDAWHLFLPDAKGSDHSRPLCGPVLRGGGMHPPDSGVGSRSQSLFLSQTESYLGRSLSAHSRGGTLCSSAQRPASGPRRRPEASTAALRLVPAFPASRTEPGCLPAGTLGRAPVKNTHPERGSNPAGPSASFPRSSSPQPRRPGSFLLAKQRIANQAITEKERLQQTLVTALFPSDCPTLRAGTGKR